VHHVFTHKTQFILSEIGLDPGLRAELRDKDHTQFLVALKQLKINNLTV